MILYKINLITLLTHLVVERFSTCYGIRRIITKFTRLFLFSLPLCITIRLETSPILIVWQISELIWRSVYTFRTKAKEHECRSFPNPPPPLLSSFRRLVYTARNVLIRPSSVVFPTLWTQLKLDVDLHVSSLPTPDSFFSRSRLNDYSGESIFIFFSMASDVSQPSSRPFSSQVSLFVNIIYNINLSDPINMFSLCFLILKFLQYRLITPR
jgi:hypothetical protein